MPDTPTHIIKPTRTWVLFDIRELIRYSDLIIFLVLRDIKIRYVQSILGIGWALIQPLCSMLVFTFIFGHLAGIGSDGIPYGLFSYAALVPWAYFSSSVGDASSSLVTNSHMITKIYFPKLILPLAATLSKLLDFFIALSLISLLMLYYNVFPSLGILYLPFLLLLLIGVSTGTSLWLSALSIQYRDVRYSLGFLLQLLQYASPIVYPSSLIPKKYFILYSLNPLVGIIEGFRACLCTHQAPSFYLLVMSTLVTCLILVSGVFYFKNTEKIFADVA